MKTRNTTTRNNVPIGHTCTIISDDQNEVFAMDIDEDLSDDDDDEEEDTGLCAQLEDEDILTRLKNNDPTVTKLQIIFAHFDSDKEGIDASTIDWAGEEGRGSISKNIYLKSLHIDTWHGGVDNDEQGIVNAKAFLWEVSQNRSIKHLYIDSSPIMNGEMMTIVTPFFMNNSLLSLIATNFDMATRSTKILVAGLSKHHSLRRFVFQSYGGGWGDESKVVGALDMHHKLNELDLCFNDTNTYGKFQAKWCTELGKLLSKPKSKLKVLKLDKNDLGDQCGIILGQSFQKNSTLKKLSMNEIGSSMTAIGWTAIFKGLSSNPNCVLEEINIDSTNPRIQTTNMPRQNKLGKGVLALSKIKTLEEVNMRYNSSITSYGWRALLSSLIKPKNSTLTSIKLDGCNINNQAVVVLGNVLKNNSSLETLSLVGNEYITTSGWIGFFKCLSSNFSVAELNLRDNNIDDESLDAFTSSLGNNTTLKDLNLGYNEAVSCIGWHSFFDMFKIHRSALQELNLDGNNVDDASVYSFLGASIHDSLTSLHLEENESITAIGLRALSTLLQRPHSRLTELYLNDNGNFSHEILIDFAFSLVGNTSLNILSLGRTNIKKRGWIALANVLCNKSSIDSTYDSNHTLQRVNWQEDNLPSDLVSYFELNRNGNKAAVARRKILKYHFSNEDNVVQPFVDMDLGVLPQVLAWIGREDIEHSLLYRLVKDMPSLFDCSLAVVKAGGTKRKIGC